VRLQIQDTSGCADVNDPTTDNGASGNGPAALDEVLALVEQQGNTYLDMLGKVTPAATHQRQHARRLLLMLMLPLPLLPCPCTPLRAAGSSLPCFFAEV
jgi:hypothetical protein